MLHKVTLATDRHEQMLDITVQVQNLVEQQKIDQGLVLVYCPHTTAAITINENADPAVVHDLLMRLNEMYPWNHHVETVVLMSRL